jgi:flagellar hook protein FlgE
MYSAISGLNANGVSLSVIGDNIANMNTVGFKESRAEFADLLSQSIGRSAGNSQIGRGVMVSDVSPLFTQGSFETTSSPLDMAVDGDGFFIVNQTGANYYTRAGQFSIDATGYVVNPEGLRLQGYQYTAAGLPTSVVGDVNLSSVNSQPNPTANASMTVNLDSRENATGPFNIANPQQTSNYSTSMTIYDSLGNPHLVTNYFTKTGANTWDYNVVAAVDIAGTLGVISNGTLQFSSAGALTAPAGGTFATTFDFSPWGAAAGQTTTFNVGNMTQYGSASSTIALSQDGYTSGDLLSLSISDTGVATGVFTNGQTRPMAQVALARFSAPTELTKLGRNLYAESVGSGTPVVGQPKNSGNGRLLSQTLEQSNVDLADEFVKMISAQRGFQANSRVITTSDELMQELVNLKR